MMRKTKSVMVTQLGNSDSTTSRRTAGTDDVSVGAEKVNSESARTMSSGKLFQSWAAATGKARLLTVDSLVAQQDGGSHQNEALVDQVDRRRG